MLKGIAMVLLDSNIFILDRFFPRDSLYAQNKALVENLASIDASISSFTLLEVCGVASFRLSADELIILALRLWHHLPRLLS